MTTTVIPQTSIPFECVCKYQYEEFPQGSVIYNETDGEGWCFTAYCNATFKVYDESGCCFHYVCEYCMGPDETPKQPGEKWQSNCQECECGINSSNVHCKPVECPVQQNVTCEKTGQVVVNETVDCCQKIRCECDLKLCSISNHTCLEGFKPLISIQNGSCCPDYYCQPKAVCVHNNTEYQPGANVPTDKCEVCKCGSSVDTATKLHVLECSPVQCDTDCQPGFEYQLVPGDCCGKCVQKSCVVVLPGNETEIIEVSN
ncbi:hypothetical protein AAFF_G00415920 [Aldrovandia affinis]|uniref:VWFC domain-containing protein n=1 Tax=Aldrovandia affinis TaxID=143900 RepID=A0AAD7R3E3_9TELE|nr:hypothetical protein AAFF_G00415920 [Aldrovandia affinis]